MRNREWYFLRIVTVVIATIFGLQFAGKISAVTQEKQTCLCAYDGYGYYMYLPQLFQYGDLYMTPERTQGVQDKYCEGANVYQLYHRDNGNYVDIYHMGQAMLELPAYCVGDVFARISGSERDGFSKPYAIAFLVNAYCFLLLGLFYTTKLLRSFFDRKIAAILLILLFLGTNYYATAIHSYQLQHLYLFALIALFFYYLQRFKIELKRLHLIYSAFSLGLLSTVRPTHVLLGIIPLIYLRGTLDKKKYWRVVLEFLAIGFVCFIPQLLYWKLVGGSWLLLNLHVEEIILVDPHLSDFLWSYKKGWLTYTPLFLLLVPGFFLLWRHNKRLFTALFPITILMIWVFASWECWYYASSFGSRVMVDLYPLLIIPVGYVLDSLWKMRKWKGVLLVFLVATFTLNAIQSYQFGKGYLHEERMTREHYWYIFGKLHPEDYDDTRLSINRRDSDWPEHLRNKVENFAVIDTVTFGHSGKQEIPGGEDLLLLDKELLPFFKTDEVQLLAEICYINKDSTFSPELRMETHSKYNVYDWQTILLTPTSGEKDTIRYRFNLPVVNHYRDKIQIYIINKPNRSALTVEQFKIDAIRLTRK